jgi:hypothetical protein
MNLVKLTKIIGIGGFLLLFFFGFLFGDLNCRQITKEEYCLKKAKEWREWKDPLSEKELSQLFKLEYECRKTLGAKTQEALKPLVVAVSNDVEKSLCGRTLGETRSVNKHSGKCFRDGVVQEYFSTQKLQEPYFAFSQVTEYVSPITHRLFKMSFHYGDVTFSKGFPLPQGRYQSGSQLLEEGRNILADLSSWAGCQLQEFRLMTTVWPYRPGVKMSRIWGGPIPASYLWNESEWMVARHADAVSTTVIGRVRIRLQLSITYYDEFSVSLEILDLEEEKRSRAEFEELSAEAKSRVRDRGVRRSSSQTGDDIEYIDVDI